ncbi:MAG: acyl-CoA dehydrogenase family protein [Actinomycetes bacterium]
MAEVRVSYAPTEEITLLRNTAREFLSDQIPLARVRELMAGPDGFERGLWQQMADLGWTGLTIPEEHGGAGYGPVELAVIFEEMGRMVTPGPFFATVGLAVPLVLSLPDDDRKSGLLGGIASGETIATVAAFEKPRDWDLSAVETTATQEGGRWVLNGVKRHVLDGHMADLFLVAARTGDGLAVFPVSAGADGLSVEQVDTLDLTRRQSTVTLDGVASDGPLGGGPAGEALARALAFASSLLANEQVGGAQRCLEMSTEYAKTRHQFGRPIGSFQAVKHRCAQMLVKVEHAKSVAYHAVRVTDEPEEFAIAAPLAASVASESYVWAAGENIQIHGGIGFTWEHDAHLYLKRAKSSSLLLGDPRYHRKRLGDVLGL